MRHLSTTYTSVFSRSDSVTRTMLPSGDESTEWVEPCAHDPLLKPMHGTLQRKCTIVAEDTLEFPSQMLGQLGDPCS